MYEHSVLKLVFFCTRHHQDRGPLDDPATRCRIHLFLPCSIHVMSTSILDCFESLCQSDTPQFVISQVLTDYLIVVLILHTIQVLTSVLLYL